MPFLWVCGHVWWRKASVLWVLVGKSGEYSHRYVDNVGIIVDGDVGKNGS